MTACPIRLCESRCEFHRGIASTESNRFDDHPVAVDATRKLHALRAVARLLVALNQIPVVKERDRCSLLVRLDAGVWDASLQTRQQFFGG